MAWYCGTATIPASSALTERPPLFCSVCVEHLAWATSISQSSDWIRSRQYQGPAWTSYVLSNAGVVVIRKAKHGVRRVYIASDWGTTDNTVVLVMKSQHCPQAAEHKSGHQV
jgi:hypothetical protein